MALTINNTISSPLVVSKATQTINPFATFTAADQVGAQEVITVTLTSSIIDGNTTAFGTLSDPITGVTAGAVGGKVTLTENFSAKTAGDTQALLRRLVYSPPTMNSGDYDEVQAQISGTSNGLPATVTPSPLAVFDVVTVPTITNTGPNPVILTSATASSSPFSGMSVTDTINGVETVKVVLNGSGKLSDPLPGSTGSFDASTHTFTETGTVTGAGPTPATQILNRLVYTPGAINSASTFDDEIATISVSTTLKTSTTLNLGTTPPQVERIILATPPAIVGALADQPFASGGGTVNPFLPLVSITPGTPNNNDSYKVTISLLENGAPATDGSLAGTGLTGGDGGVYTFTASGTAGVLAELKSLAFTPNPVAAGGKRTTQFQVAIADLTTGLTGTNTTTSVTVSGSGQASAPLIAGAPSNQTQTTTSGTNINPFAGVTVSDPSANPSDSAIITLIGGGTLSGNGLQPGDTSGTYKIAAESPAALTTAINNLSFTPPTLGSGQNSVTSTLKLEVDNGSGQNFASTQVVTQAPGSQPPGSQPSPPLIAGVSTNRAQNAQSGQNINPFTGVSVSDQNANPSDNAIITLTGGGTLSGNGLQPGSTPGTYTIAAESPSALTTAIDNLTFTPPTVAAGQTATSSLRLEVDNAAGQNVAITQVTTSGNGQPSGDVYRFFDTKFGTHFFTASATERDTVEATRPDLKFEGVGMHDLGSPTGDANAVQVYRFFDTVHGTHFFTADAGEKATVQATRTDLVFEASASFYEHSTQQAGDAAVYRFFDTHLGTHFYTADAGEKASIQATRTDLTFEGVSFYAPSS